MLTWIGACHICLIELSKYGRLIDAISKNYGICKTRRFKDLKRVKTVEKISSVHWPDVLTNLRIHKLSR